MDSTLSQYQLKSLGRETARCVKKFYENPENEQRFQKWFLATRGYPYPIKKEIANEKMA